MRIPTPGGTGNAIFIRLRQVTWTRFICFHCGFSEEWFESRDGLDRLRARFGLLRDREAAPDGSESIERELGLS